MVKPGKVGDYWGTAEPSRGNRESGEWLEDGGVLISMVVKVGTYAKSIFVNFWL